MANRMCRQQVLLSAHRGGCGRSPEKENTLAAFMDAVAMSVEYIEFDIQRTKDGIFLLNHENRVMTRNGWLKISEMNFDEVEKFLGPRVKYEQVLSIIAQAKRKAHMDFKFTSPVEVYENVDMSWEVEAVKIARQYLSDEDFIVTSTEDESVKAVRDWSVTNNVNVLAGLSIGKHRLSDLSWWRQGLWRLNNELFPERRIRKTGANLIVAQRHLAKWRLLSWAYRNNLPVLVWTVDSPREMRKLIRDKRVWMITSNYPERGIALRNTILSNLVDFC